MFVFPCIFCCVSTVFHAYFLDIDDVFNGNMDYCIISRIELVTYFHFVYRARFYFIS